MRRILLPAAVAALASAAAASAPIEAGGAARQALRAATPGARLVWWHAGGVTPAGTRWHAGGADGYRWGGAASGGAYHGYVHGWGDAHYGGYYRPPVVVTPWIHPAGTIAAGAAVGVAAGTAAATANHYAQPPTVVNNYYYNE
ncbi:hypothetical protein [Neoroseomonas soli]|uniref:hypothetical protein n=1 Tax=Neoroseomonas soli TaxID=1081025 RepID=UPI001BAD6C21|nr:hypothetical protein [Neoroseomonas soli]